MLGDIGKVAAAGLIAVVFALGCASLGLLALGLVCGPLAVVQLCGAWDTKEDDDED